MEFAKISTIFFLAAATAGSAFAQQPVKVSPARVGKASVVKVAPDFLRQPTAADKDITILKSEKVAPGVESRIVRDGSGRVYRSLVRDGVATHVPARMARLPWKVTANPSFYEGFEGWDGVNPWSDWIPEGWTEKNTDGSKCTEESLKWYYNNSWHVGFTGDGYWTAVTTDGEKECFCHFTYDCFDTSSGDTPTIKYAMTPQDEWLISPKFNVKNGHKLMFLAQLAPADLFFYDYSTKTLNTDQISCDIEVLASTDDGANWTSLWKATDYFLQNMPYADMVNTVAKLEYYSIIVPMEAYFDKEVKLAFRYTNRSYHNDEGYLSVGNSVAIDGVTVDGMTAEATYNLPYGMYMAGMTENLWAATQSYALLPPFYTTYWTAIPNDFTDKIEWKYYDDKTGEMSKTSDAVTITAAYPRSQGVAYPYPELTATNVFSSNTYSFDMNDTKKGGIFYDSRMPLLQGERMLAATYDYPHKMLRMPMFEGGEPVFGKSAAGAWGAGYEETAFGNMFPVPARNFEIEKVVVTLGKYDADADAVFTMDIHTLDVFGNPSAKPAYSTTIKGSDVKKVDELYQAVFPITDADGNPATFTQSWDPIVVFISGFAGNDKVRAFAGCDQQFGNVAETVYDYTYLRFNVKDADGNVTEKVSKGSQALQNYFNSTYISLDGHFKYIGTANKEITIYSDDEAVEVPFDSDSDPEKWTVQLPGSTERLSLKDAVTSDWLTIKAEAGTDETHKVIFTATKPAENRSMELTFRAPGASYKVTVKQSTQSGIGQAIVNDGLSVKAGRNMIAVSGAAPAQPIVVYSINGSIVGRYIADMQGAANIAHSLGAGLYIVKVGNRAFKVML